MKPLKRDPQQVPPSLALPCERETSNRCSKGTKTAYTSNSTKSEQAWLTSHKQAIISTHWKTARSLWKGSKNPTHSLLFLVWGPTRCSMIVYMIWCSSQAIRSFSEICWQLLLTYSLPILTTTSLQKAHGKHQSRQHLQMRHLSDIFFLLSSTQCTHTTQNQMHLYTVLITPAVSSRTFHVCCRIRYRRFITSARKYWGGNHRSKIYTNRSSQNSIDTFLWLETDKNYCFRKDLTL